MTALRGGFYFVLDNHTNYDTLSLNNVRRIVVACVYILRNIVNNKLYVGQSVDTAERRFQSHKSTLKRLQESGEKRGRNWSRLYCAMDKYGLSSFVIDKEIPCSLEKMDDLEKELIAEFKTIKIGYNVCEGGSGGNVKFRTDDFKQKCQKVLSELGLKVNMKIGNLYSSQMTD